MTGQNMGKEYRITVESHRRPELRTWLERRGARVFIFEGQERAEFRFTHPADHSKMPDATVILEEAGIYFCDHLGHREKTAVIFKDLIDEALTRSGPSDSVTVKSL